MAPLRILERAMGVNLSIKSVPEDWAERLRQRAERNHRSLQGELMAMLEQSLQEAPAPGARSLPAAPVGRQRGTLSVEEISRRAAARYARLPPEQRDSLSSVDIVREMRDSRWS
jgi:antitoxin FitA